jgi:RNA polymerase sigma factor (sigma-70 family)
MSALGVNRIVQRLKNVADTSTTDAQLLNSFLVEREEAAFATLVRRHGPMVLSVCRRMLGNTHDADDAFQATFLILVRKASSITQRDLLGPWLYRVAYHAALEAKAKIARLRIREQPMINETLTAVSLQQESHELLPLLDRELNRLPEKFRVPVILCDLEGRSRKEVAEQLGLPEGTLSSRLATARRLLAQRISRRGLAVSGGTLATTLATNSAIACVPSTLFASTMDAAVAVALGKTLAVATVSAQVTSLTDGVLKAMYIAKLKLGAAVATGALFLAGGGSWLTSQLTAAESEPVKKTASKPAGNEKPADQPPMNEKDIRAEKPAWGDPVQGIQIRAIPEKAEWTAKEVPTFILDLRMDPKSLATDVIAEFGYIDRVEIDGKWYGPSAVRSKPRFRGGFGGNWIRLKSDQEQNGFETVDLDEFELPDSREKFPQPAMGKHTVRVSVLFTVNRGLVHTGEVQLLPPPVHTVSKAVVIEIKQEKPVVAVPESDAWSNWLKVKSWSWLEKETPVAKEPWQKLFSDAKSAYHRDSKAGQLEYLRQLQRALNTKPSRGGELQIRMAMGDAMVANFSHHLDDEAIPWYAQILNEFKDLPNSNEVMLAKLRLANQLHTHKDREAYRSSFIRLFSEIIEAPETAIVVLNDDQFLTLEKALKAGYPAKERQRMADSGAPRANLDQLDVEYGKRLVQNGVEQFVALRKSASTLLARAQYVDGDFAKTRANLIKLQKYRPDDKLVQDAVATYLRDVKEEEPDRH